MRHEARRWLAGFCAAAAVGGWVAAQAGTAGAATVGQAGSGQLSASTRLASVVPAGAVYRPSGGILTLGSRGAAVRALQLRLNFLHYYAGKADGYLGWDTMEAVWAFKEVQSGEMIPSKPDIVGPAMQHQLVNPKLPPVLYPHGGPSRVEINKKLEVLVVYRDNKQVLISHTSSAAYYRPDGTGWVTPDGRYSALEYVPGCVPDATFGGCMYNPVFFIGTSFAIHGMPNPTSTFSGFGVPLNPASHGCVRIPLDISEFLHTLIKVGGHGSLIYVGGPNYYGNGAFQ